MDINDIDFEGTGAGTTGANGGSEPQNGASGGEDPNRNVSSLDGKKTDDITSKSNASDDDKHDDVNANAGADDKGGEGKGDAAASSTGELTPGTQISLGDKTYTVADNGDVVDADGNVIKKADEVSDWLKEFEQEDETESGNIGAIQSAIGIDIIDEKGNTVEFADTPEGIKDYVAAVVDLQRKEIADGAINKLYADNPYLRDFQNYVAVYGSPAGFGELPDRTNWEIDKDNVNQQEAIIRIAANEFGNKTLNDNYIKYLKDTGSLYDEAKAQLDALKQNDLNIRAEYARQAEANRAQSEAELNEYWDKVYNVINSRTIGEYKLPSSFVKNVNGQKQTLTLNDFFDYISKNNVASAKGNVITAYMKDLEDESEEDYMNRELLNAWLKFTGGTYKDLIDMAIKEQEVKTLKLKSKANSTKKTVKIVKPAKSKFDPNDLILG